MLSSRQAFKAGFLQKCAEAGLTADEAMAMAKEGAQLIKASAKTWSDLLMFNPIESAIAAGSGLVGATAGHVANTGLTGLMVAPPLLGVAGGLAASALTDVDKTDVSAVKKRELIDEYLRQANRLRQRTAGSERANG